jgi:hypothetical protein
MCLCYCISGGLPRDLIRTCRNLIIAAEHFGDEKQLDALCGALLQADISSKVQALETAASEIPLSESVGFIELLNSLDVRSLSDNAAITAALSTPVPVVSNGNPTDHLLDSYASLNHIRSELGIYMIYVGLIFTLFTRLPWGHAELTTPEANRTFERMARLRQAFAINPGFAASLARELMTKGSEPPTAPAAQITSSPRIAEH